MEDQNRQLLLRFFRALADETRLKIIGLLAQQDRSVEELATLLDLRAPTISHHLTKLKDAELIQMQRDGTTHIYHLDVQALQQMHKDMLLPEKTRALVSPAHPQDSWEQKILNDFSTEGRLKEIPAMRKKRDVILHWLAGQFKIDHPYTEAEVNAIIKHYHHDTATLRRELIGMQLMEREAGIYRRTTPAP